MVIKQMVAASNHAAGAYSNRMEWRRITGSFLAAVLLLTIALPAMCGQCHVAAAEPSCAEQHKSSAHSHHAAAASVQTSCKSCANIFAVSGARPKREMPNAALNATSGAAKSCQTQSATDVAAFSAAPAQGRSFERLRYAANAADQVLLSALTTCASDGTRLRDQNSFSIPQQKLSPILKI
jgi:hypothetical protein